MRDDFSNRTVLITGGSGFVGFNLAHALRFAYNVHFTYCDHKLAIRHAFSHKANLRSENEIAMLFDRVSPGTIIHCAALTHTEKCEEDWDLAYRTNVKATYDLVERANANRCRLIYLSTDMVFDGERGNYEEPDATFPGSRYGRTKQLAEETVLEHSRSNTVVLRPGLIYGWGSPTSGGFTQWMRQSLEEGKPLRLYEDEFRTPIYIKDLVSIIKEILKKDCKGIFHVAGREKVSRYDFGLQFARTFGYDEKLIERASLADHPGKVRRPPDISLNISKARRYFLTTLAGMEDGLSRMKESEPKEAASAGGLAS